MLIENVYLFTAPHTPTNSGSIVGTPSPTASRSSDDTDRMKLDENVPTKPQSLSEKTPKDEQSDKAHDKSNLKNNNSIDVPWTQVQKQEELQPSAEKSLNTDSVKVKDSVNTDIIPSSPSPSTSPSPSKNDNKFDGTQNRSIKSPPSTPISMSNIKSPSIKSSHKKTTRKSTCSLSEDTGDEYTQSASASASALASKSDKETKKTVESKKLTREERKMEAIVRAFEKMEKTEQRKNEQNKHKLGSNAPNNSNSSNKKRNSSSFGKDDVDKIKKSNNPSGKRKRKRGKSYSQSSNQKRRRNRFDSHNSDDGNT